MKPSRIIIHHSLTKDSQTVSWGAIRQYHVDVCGWMDIGYHFGIELMRGEVETVLGRFPDKMGAHCKGNNSDSLGVCFVGNFDLRAPSNSIWNKGVDLVKFLIREYDIKIVEGHCENNTAKSCPGKYFDLDKFRRECGVA